MLPQPRPICLGAAFDAWLHHKERLATMGALEMGSAAVMRRRSRPILAHFGADRPLRAITYGALELYVAKRQRAGRAGSTINKELLAFKAMNDFCTREGYVAASLPRTPSAKVEAVEKPLPDDDALARVLNSLTPAHRDACLFMLLTGLSPHELERLEPGDIDMAKRMVAIGQRADFKVKVAARRRTIPLNPQAVQIARAAIERHQQTGRPLFPSRAALAKQMERSCPRSGPAITPKLMRSIFASTVATKTPEHTLQALMGHAPGSPVTRRHYIRSTAADTRAALAKHKVPAGLTLPS